MNFYLFSLMFEYAVIADVLPGHRVRDGVICLVGGSSIERIHLPGDKYVIGATTHYWRRTSSRKMSWCLGGGGNVGIRDGLEMSSVY